MDILSPSELNLIQVIWARTSYRIPWRYNFFSLIVSLVVKHTSILSRSPWYEIRNRLLYTELMEIVACVDAGHP